MQANENISRNKYFKQVLFGTYMLYIVLKKNYIFWTLQNIVAMYMEN